MSFDSTITTIDIWSSKIRTVIGSFDEENGNRFVVLGVWISPSTAIRKGNILDMEEFKNNLDRSLEEAEKMAWEQVSSVYISLNSSSFDVITNKWIIAISSEEISQDDVDRVLDMAKWGVDLPNREILKVIPEFFSVDLEDWVKNPIGMSARKLEVLAHIFTMNTNVLNNIKRAVRDVWIEIIDVYPNLLSSPEWVLTKRQKELWVVCVDIWSSTTWITVYEEWVLKHSAVIPIWWDNVTNDIALWLRTSTIVWEKLKLEYASLNTSKKEISERELDLTRLNVWEEWIIDLAYLAQIVTARYEELLYFVKEELKVIWRDWMLPEWAVFVWGGSKMSNFLDLAKDVLKLPAFIWIPSTNDDLADTSINDPVFSATIWTLIFANKYWVAKTGISFNLSGIFHSIVKVFKKILP